MNGLKKPGSRIKMSKSLKRGDKPKKVRTQDHIGSRGDPFNRASGWMSKKRRS